MTTTTQEALDYILQRFNIKHIPEHTKPIEIPFTTRLDLAALFADLGFKEGVEIGILKGEYSTALLSANPGLTLHCVDAWEAAAFDHFVEGWSKEQAAYDGFYKETKAQLKQFGARAHIIKAYSLKAVKRFVDNSLDFVYIEANHNFVNFTNDLYEWGKKVRPGGIISGHDYARFKLKHDVHCKAVLNAWTNCYGVKPWFVLGENDKNIDTERDLYRSWFWVKGCEAQLPQRD